MKIRKKRCLSNLIIILAACMCSLLITNTKISASEAEGDIIEMTQEEVDEVLSQNISEDYGIVPCSTGLSICKLSIVSDGNYLKIVFQTSANAKASKIGVKGLKVQKQDSSTWKTIYPQSGSYDFKKTNTKICRGGFKISKKAAKKKYRVTSIHYAIIGGKTLTKNKTTAAITH